MNDVRAERHDWSGRIAPATLGLMASLIVLATLIQPGITSDEPLDVGVGLHYLEHTGAWLRLYRGLIGGSAQARDASLLFQGNAQHPPLGRLLVGLAALAGQPLAQLPGGMDRVGVFPGRLAPALAFGVLVALVGLQARRIGGDAAGLVASFSLLVMPRAFAHAHLATLDTLVTTFWVLALFRAMEATEARRLRLALAGAGLLWGLALLTKIHAWLLPPLVTVWLFHRLAWRRAATGLASWLLSGLGLFFLGWPWLWFDTVKRLGDYLSTSVDRLSLKVMYLGRVYQDDAVPWHYPWVLLAVTVPLGLHAIGLVGARAAWTHRHTDRRGLFLAGAALAVLGLFSTSVAVYDGVRLFLMVLPLWAVLIGIGFGRLWASLAQRQAMRFALIGFLLAQAWGVIALNPFGLSYYSLAIGGLRGAEALGLELTYWGDTVNVPLLDELANRAAPGARAALVPTLHPFQAAASTTPHLLQRGVILEDESALATADWLVVYRREAYWPEALRAELARRPCVAWQSRQGVWLAGLWGPHRRPNPPQPPAR